MRTLPSRATPGIRAWPGRAFAPIVLVLALALPAQASAGPAADEYKLRFPNAKGNGDANPEAPQAQLDQLPPEVARELANDPEGKALATIATAKALGAPDTLEASGGDDGSLLDDLVAWITDPLVVAVVLAMAAIATGAVMLGRRRRALGVQ